MSKNNNNQHRILLLIGIIIIIVGGAFIWIKLASSNSSNKQLSCHTKRLTAQDQQMYHTNVKSIKLCQ